MTDIITIVLSLIALLSLVGYFKIKFDKEWMTRDHEMENFKSSVYRQIDSMEDRMDHLKDEMECCRKTACKQGTPSY